MKNKYLLLILYILLSINIVNAASIKNKEINLYPLGEDFEQFLTRPSSYKVEDKIIVEGYNGTITYKVKSGESAIVDENGVVKPYVEVLYCYGSFCTTVYNPSFTKELYYKKGKTIIEVTAGNEKFDVTVNVEMYETTAAKQIMNDYIKENITNDMTSYEKMVKIMQFIATTKYSYKSSSLEGLVVGEGADCIGDAYAILYMAEQVGIEAHMRLANKDPGAGSNHHNVAALLDKGDGQGAKIYIPDVNSVNPSDGSPRRFWIDRTDGDFSLYGDAHVLLVQYDGYDEIVTLPEDYRALGEFAFSRGVHNKTKVRVVNISDSLSSIGKAAFARVDTLTTINVGPNNETFASRDGILYSKDYTKIVAFPSGRPEKTFTIPNGVKEIGDYAFYYTNNLNKIVIPNTVEKIGNNAFELFSSNYDRQEGIEGIVLPSSVKEVGDYISLLSQGKNGSKYIVVKNKNATLGKGLCNTITPMYGIKGSTAETYASTNNCPFVELTNINQTDFTVINNLTYTIDEYVTIGERGTDNKPNVVIKNGNYTLKENVDYKIELTNNTTETNEASIKIYGIGSYAGMIRGTYKISKLKSLTNAKIEYSTDFNQDFYKFRDNLKVSYNGTELKVGYDYDFYGQATGDPKIKKYMIYGKGEYTGKIDMYLYDSIPGDFNNNGKIDLTDILCALKIHFGTIKPNEYQQKVSDMNSDSKFDLTDVLLLLKEFFKNN